MSKFLSRLLACNLGKAGLILLTAVVANASQRHDLMTGRTQLRKPQSRDEMRQVERFQEACRDFLVHCLIGLDTAVDPAVRDHLLAVHPGLDSFHADDWAAIRSGPCSNLNRDSINPAPSHELLMASGIPDHKITWLSTLGHLPVVYRATCSDPVFQLADVLGIAIHLKYMNFNQGAFQVQMSSRRDAIIPVGAATGTAAGQISPAPTARGDLAPNLGSRRAVRGK